jgi:hypothetical protein
MPDNQPGFEFEWWFLTGVPGLSTTDTLLTVWTIDGPVDLHYSVFTKRSDTIDNGDLELTAHDMESLSGSMILGGMADQQAKKLLIDLDGDGEDDHYFGYVKFARECCEGLYNAIVAQTMIADIVGGMFSMDFVPVRQILDRDRAFPQNLVGPNGVEVFTGWALALAEAAQMGFIHDNGYRIRPWFLKLAPRYYVNSSSANSYLITWFDKNHDVDMHVNFWDNEENPHSTNIPFPDELNILDLADGWIPKGLYPSDKFPKEGYFFFGFDYAGLRGVFSSLRDEVLAWTWIKDAGLDQEPLSGLTSVPRFTFWDARFESTADGEYTIGTPGGVYPPDSDFPQDPPD